MDEAVCNDLPDFEWRVNQIGWHQTEIRCHPILQCSRSKNTYEEEDGGIDSEQPRDCLGEWRKAKRHLVTCAAYQKSAPGLLVICLSFRHWHNRQASMPTIINGSDAKNHIIFRDF